MAVKGVARPRKGAPRTVRIAPTLVDSWKRTNLMMGGLQRRRIVHPVAGHRHDMALGLQGFDNAHLVFGGDPGEDGTLLDQRGDLALAESVEFTPFMGFAL